MFSSLVFIVILCLVIVFIHVRLDLIPYFMLILLSANFGLIWGFIFCWLIDMILVGLDSN